MKELAKLPDVEIPDPSPVTKARRALFLKEIGKTEEEMEAHYKELSKLPVAHPSEMPWPGDVPSGIVGK